MDTISEWLGREAGLIQGLFRSLNKHEGQGWETEVPIPGNRVSGLTARLGFLAAQFLTRWHHWNQVLSRHGRFWNWPTNPVRGSDQAKWTRIDSQCMTMAGAILRDSGLGDLLADDWMGDLAEEDVEAFVGPFGLANRSFGEIVEGRLNLLIKTHQLLGLVRQFETILGKTGNNNDILGDGWLSYRRKVETWNTRILRAWPQFGFSDAVNALPLQLLVDRAMEPFLRYHGGYFAHSSLLYSWLAKNGNNQFNRESFLGKLAWRGVGDISALEAMIWGGDRMLNIPDETLMTVFGDNGTQEARQWLGRIAGAISQTGFATFAASVAHGATGEGGFGYFAGAAINVIPGGVPGACQRTLLAVAKGTDDSNGFDPVMRRVREHLIACPVTKAVVVICDHWHPEILKEHRGDLRAHHAHNSVQFLFLLSGTPRDLSVVGVNRDAF